MTKYGTLPQTDFILNSVVYILHFLDVDLEASDQANVVHSIKCNIYIHLSVKLNFYFYSNILYLMKKEQLFNRLFDFHSSPSCPYILLEIANTNNELQSCDIKFCINIVV